MRAARLLLLAVFAAGWAGSALGVPALILMVGGGHAVRLASEETHRAVVLHHHGRDAPNHPGAMPAQDWVGHHPEADGGAVPHGDHAFHLPDLAPVLLVKGPTLHAATLVSLLVPGWSLREMGTSLPSASEPEVPVPDGMRAALRTTVLLV